MVYCKPIWQNENPGDGGLQGFLFRFGRVAYALGWLLLLLISVQPFADEVANHTCRNRDNKSDEKISHMTTLLPVPI